MNVYDSEQIASGLRTMGYQQDSSIKKADLVIVNTCSIREKAEQKAFSFLGRLASLKMKKPELIIGVGGCVAQQEGKRILSRAPYIDIVFGTHAVGRLPHHIKEIRKKRSRIVDIEMTATIEESEGFRDFSGNRGVSRFVTIMRGCDNYCSYCVVPFVRGRETSRSPESIINEIKSCVESGTREITLLGQNVNSYGIKENRISFAELLSWINDIDGLFRIRFITSHPKDFSEDLMVAFKDVDKLCNHIHLPVQSGSNQILKKMNRKYTRELYLEKIKKLRCFCPDIAVTSDFIVGFPGESESNFQETLDLIELVAFDGLFAFAYSDRPNTPSTRFSNKVSEMEKAERLQKLLKLQETITRKKNAALVGKTVTVLVEGLSKKQDQIEVPSRFDDIQWTGRTPTGKIVNFIQNGSRGLLNDIIDVGKLVDVSIDKAYSHSLAGRSVKI